jgi:tetratricopeptide (TPR) repeat protein
MPSRADANTSIARLALLLAYCVVFAFPPGAMAQSSDSNAAFARAVDLQEAGRFEEAIVAYSEAIQLGSNDLAAYNNRGAAYGALKEYERAIPDFDRALQLNPRYAEAYGNRGAAFGALKQYEAAIRDLGKAVELDPNYARAYNNLAWLLATAEQPSVRDGGRAVELALRACRLSSCQDAYLIDTLAAAYARKGQFGKAIEWQRKSMAQPGDPADRERQMRLNLYRKGKAWPPD